MTPNHVSTDHVPLQGQSIYNDPSYEHLFPRVNQYGAASWDQFNPNHTSLLPQGSGTQSWHQNSVPQQSYNQVSPYGNANPTYQSTSPYNQFAQFNNRGALSNYGRQSNIDPALGNDTSALRQQQQSPFQQALRTITPNGQATTITPQALQQQQQQQQNGASLPAARPAASPYQIPKSTAEIFAQRTNQNPVQVSQPVSNPVLEVPKGKVSGGGISLIDQAALVEATKSTALNKLVNFGAEPFHLATNRTAMPMYTPRQSLKDIRKAGSHNRKIIDKPSKKLSSKRILLSKQAGAGKLIAGSPASLQRDVTDSDSYTDSSDDSEYTDDEDDEPSPLPASRPDEPHAAVRYDVIKATWYASRSSPTSEKIKDSLRDLWEVLNTIQKRWRADSKAVTEAEEQKKKGELPVLKSRVTSQRDLLESALRSALEFGHPDVLWHLGQVKAFLYLCYQFLANRFKMQDYDGGLPSVIYEVLVRSVGTLTTELIEETKLIKALHSMKKNTNEKNKGLIQQIIDGAASGSKKPKASPPRDEVAEQKNGKRPAPQPAARPATEGTIAKKPKVAEPAVGAVRKVNPPSVQGLKTGINTSPIPQKRPGERSAIPPAKSRANQVVNKPSTFFSALSAATKKPTPAVTPGTKPTAPSKPAVPAAKDKKPATTTSSKPAFSFADTMAELLGPKEQPSAPTKPEKQIPSETAEEKAKRLRKESRRHLRVSFRPDATLVSIKYFHHDPEEEIRHDENFVRDAGDIGGEGRMFKQHRELEEDDDDDEEEETEYRPWKDPSDVDFNRVEVDERNRNFAPYGGGERRPECPEKEANIRRENSTLIVFYTNRNEIPPSPKEPAEQQDQSSAREPRIFGEPPKFVLDRSPQAPRPVADFSNLESIFNQFASNNTSTAQMTATPNIFSQPPPAAQAAAPAAPDLSAILKNLQAQASQQASAPAPAPAPIPVSIPPPPQGTQPLPNFSLPPELAALVTAMQGANGGLTAPPPLPAGWAQFAPSFPQLPQQPQQQGSSYPQPQQSQYDQQQSSSSNKRQREDTGANNNNNNGDRGFGSHKKQKNKHADGKFRVIPCKFYQQGKCTKGADCTFIHDQN